MFSELKTRIDVLPRVKKFKLYYPSVSQRTIWNKKKQHNARRHLLGEERGIIFRKRYINNQENNRT